MSERVTVCRRPDRTQVDGRDYDVGVCNTQSGSVVRCSPPT
jgi:hypothetical protein